MAILRDESIDCFIEDLRDRDLYLWGAGKLVEHYMSTFCSGCKIKAIVDNNSQLSGTKRIINGNIYDIISEVEFGSICRGNSNVVLLITPTCYCYEIYKQLDSNSNYNDLLCYLGVLLRDYYIPKDFILKRVNGSKKIPSIIHYCWFGKKEMPDKFKRNIASWEKYCPDCQIVRWDETNYDITKNRYMLEAYQQGRWAFVPDYARLDIIYNEGGVYFDTDVEIISPIDDLLFNEMFCGFQCNYQINFGSGFGAVKNNSLICELRDYYDDLSFVQTDGKLNLKTCYEYQHPVLMKFGFNLINEYQEISEHVIYPSEVLAPTMGIKQHFTQNSVSIHHLEYSWASDREKRLWEEIKMKFSRT